MTAPRPSPSPMTTLAPAHPGDVPSDDIVEAAVSALHASVNGFIDSDSDSDSDSDADDDVSVSVQQAQAVLDDALAAHGALQQRLTEADVR